MYWKFIVKGDTPTDVHGVNLRESIQKLALNKEFKLEGQVRNLKGTDQLEVICQTDSEDLVETLREAIKTKIPEKNILVEPKNIKISEKNEIQDATLKNFETFEIVREDELTEMAWALQSAGKAVLSQDKVRAKNLIRGIQQEIELIRQHIVNIRNKENKHRIRFILLAIKNLLKEPPESCENLAATLYSVYVYCEAINIMIESGIPMDEMPLDDLEDSLEKVEKILKSSNLNA